MNRDLILLPNYIYKLLALISIHLEFLMRCPDRKCWVIPKSAIFREYWEIGNNREIFLKKEKGQYINVLSLRYTFWLRFMKKK